MALRLENALGVILCVLVIVPASRPLSVSDQMESSNSPCQLRTHCTQLETLWGEGDSAELSLKKYICQLADKASLLPESAKCKESGSETAGITKDPEIPGETLCELRLSCALIALAITAQDPQYQTMKDICQLAGKKRQLSSNILCKAIGVTDIKRNEDFEEGNAQKIASNVGQNNRPTLSRSYYFDDCSEIYVAQVTFASASSGVYTIRPVNSEAIEVYCDMDTDGGGWTVIQNRFDGSTDFNRPFGDFKYGFGPSSGEYWLGLANMYKITDQNTYELYVELVDWDDNVRYAKYSSFRVGPSSYYQLYMGSYSGTAGDGFEHSDNKRFSARDYDQDTNSGSCTAGIYTYAGAWWYGNCANSALNGPYLRPSDRTTHSGYGIYWEYFSPSTYKTYLKKSKMMIRPTDFRTGK